MEGQARLPFDSTPELQQLQTQLTSMLAQAWENQPTASLSELIRLINRQIPTPPPETPRLGTNRVQTRCK